MLKTIKQCDAIIEELNKFSRELLYLGPSILDDRLDRFEKTIGFTLPIDFKYIQKKHNGISLDGTEVYGMDKSLRGSSLDELYTFEHGSLIYNAMPAEFFPFSPDGRGNHYCLNLSKINDGICPVVFWQHDFVYNDLNGVEECNSSFMDWINDVMIGWTLDDYNYDGTEK